MYSEGKIVSSESKRIGYNLQAAVLRACAKHSDLKQKNIAEKAGVHPVTLSRILNGAGTTNDTLGKIASVIGVDPARIISKGQKPNKYSIKTLEDVLNDKRKLTQFIGAWDQQELIYANKEFSKVMNALEDYRRRVQRQQYS